MPTSHIPRVIYNRPHTRDEALSAVARLHEALRCYPKEAMVFEGWRLELDWRDSRAFWFGSAYFRRPARVTAIIRDCDSYTIAFAGDPDRRWRPAWRGIHDHLLPVFGTYGASIGGIGIVDLGPVWPEEEGVPLCRALFEVRATPGSLDPGHIDLQPLPVPVAYPRRQSREPDTEYEHLFVPSRLQLLLQGRQDD